MDETKNKNFNILLQKILTASLAVSVVLFLILFLSSCAGAPAKDDMSSVRQSKSVMAAETEVEKAKADLVKAESNLGTVKETVKKEQAEERVRKLAAAKKDVETARETFKQAVRNLTAEENKLTKIEKKEESKRVAAAKKDIKQAKKALKKAEKALAVKIKAQKKQDKIDEKARLKREKREEKERKRREKIAKEKAELARELAIKRKGKKAVIAEEKARARLAAIEKEEKERKEAEAKKKAKLEEKARKKKAKEDLKAKEKADKEAEKARKKKEKEDKKAKKKAEKEEKRKAGKTMEQKLDRLGKKMDKVRESMPQEMMEEQRIKVEPEATANILQGAFSIMVKQRIRKSFLEFGGEYDFVDSFMGFNLDYNYKIGRFYTGFEVKDSIDFNEVFSNSNFLQRVQSITPYTRPRLHKRLFAKLSLSFEDTRTTSLETSQIIDSGKNIVGALRFDHNLMVRKNKLPQGIEQSLTFMNSYQNLGSDYAYALSEYNLLGVLRVYKERYLEYKLNTGVPLNMDHRPMSAFYWAGGYKILRGYDYKEFYGDAKIYQRISYNVPLTKLEYSNVLGINFAVVTWSLAFEAVELGSKEDVFYINDTLKMSAEAGLAYKLILLKYLPLKLEFVVAKAMEPRLPKAYILLSTVFYSWSNE